MLKHPIQKGKRVMKGKGTSFESIVLGFIAGVLAAITVHELVKFFLYDANVLSASWDLTPGQDNTVAGLPRLANAGLWGGFWGAIFAVMLGNPPQGAMTLRGILLGILGPAIACVFLIFPMLNGTAVFLGGDVHAILVTLATFAAFGAATAWLYGWFTAGCRLP